MHKRISRINGYFCSRFSSHKMCELDNKVFIKKRYIRSLIKRKLEVVYFTITSIPNTPYFSMSLAL